jgi:hypothetical protein
MKPDARAARERKQKIFVLVGGLLLLALLAFQLPRLLGGSSSSSASPTADTTLAGDETGAVATQATPVALVGVDRHTGSELTKLTTLSQFAPKDPFVQQVATAAPPPVAEAAAGVASKGAKAAKPSASKGFSTKPAATAVTIVSVNGARQTLAPGATFPASDPVFVLIAEQPQSKSVVIGVVGGAYAGGAKTTKLVVGKPLTLVNTTTGAHYRISLVSVGSGDETASQKPKG